jgi:hypothetical protein
MFFLGAFSSNLIYLFITIAYFIGFGLFSIDRLHSKFSKEPAQANEIKYSGTNTSLSVNYKIADETNKKIESNNTGSFLNEPLFNKILFSRVHCALSAQVWLPDDYYFNKFSRPPPII